MSDYIKREDAIFVALQQPLYSVVSQIKQLDGIDIVPCKECMHGKERLGRYICRKLDEDWEFRFDPDHFCSDGERSDNE